MSAFAAAGKALLVSFMKLLNGLGFGLGLAVCGVGGGRAAGDAPPPGYTLVWADEFTVDGAPDPKKWRFEHGFVRNHELQFYQPDNAVVKNGILTIEARREEVPNPQYEAGSKDWRKKPEKSTYTSACMTTQGLHQWTYGRFELRARIDVRAGLWPAWWTLGVDREWPDNGEIDIMEYYTGGVLANFAWGTGKRWNAKWDAVKTPLAKLGGADWAKEFHVWRMDWTRDNVRIYLDGRLLNEIKVTAARNPDGFLPYRQPHYMLLNLALGGINGGPLEGTEFPAKFEVDWVRVYQPRP